MATSGSARVALALACAPLIHVRGPARIARVRSLVALLLAAAVVAAVMLWG